MIWSYPATNCSSVSGDSSLKWEWGHKKKKANKRKNAADNWTVCTTEGHETKTNILLPHVELKAVIRYCLFSK